MSLFAKVQCSGQFLIDAFVLSLKTITKNFDDFNTSINFLFKEYHTGSPVLCSRTAENAKN